MLLEPPEFPRKPYFTPGQIRKPKIVYKNLRKGYIY